MAGLVPAIHVLSAAKAKDVDARHKAGHDEDYCHPRGLLKRHCADGKTPLLAARLCKARLACQNEAPPE
jgi:hypothetical protein